MELNGKSLVLHGLSSVHKCRHQFSEHFDIVVDGIIIIVQIMAKQKYLGFIFDNQLTWLGHVSNICQKMHIMIGLHQLVCMFTIKLLVNSSSFSCVYSMCYQFEVCPCINIIYNDYKDFRIV